MKFGTWLMALVEPLIGRILVSLGFSVITITGMQAVFDQVKSQVISGVQSLPAATLNLFLYAGGGVGLSIILGACATKLTLWQISSSTKILGRNQS